MQLGDQQPSGNVENRRGIGVGGGLGIGGVVIAPVAYFLGFDPSMVINVAEQVSTQRSDTREVPKGAPTDETGQFVSKVLGSTETVWDKVFAQSNTRYRPPTLVLYDGQVRSACGMGQAAMGPFYCPNDEKLYLDLAFLRELQTRFRAPGDFAAAYVIAHEVGHHVQKLTGGFDRADARGRESNQNSIRMELQADCYAGVWGHYAGTMNQVDSGEIAEGLNAAAAVGDDNIQRQTQGRVSPESFTHGSSAQRQRWFKRGLDSGKPSDCDTFGANAL
jgi:predicted metalloprotease